MNKLLTGIIITLALATALLAQGELTGKWQGKTRNGFEITLDLKATDTELTGTMNRNGETIPISEGRVSKSTFTFKAKLGEQTEAFTGELSGEQITVWMDRQGRAMAAVLERVKN